MTITIKEKLRPFSHLSGTVCPVPHTTLAVELFPAKIRLYDLSSSRKALVREFDLPLPCPVRGFTVMVDVERPSVLVLGWCGKSYIRYRIVANDSKDDIVIIKEKDPFGMFPETAKISLSKPTIERLSLGCHKKQDWELVRRRHDLKEILPHWFALGQLTPCFLDQQGNSLFNDVRQAIASSQPDVAAEGFLHLFQAGFSGILTPKLYDDQMNGFTLPSINGASPLALLSEGGALIRSLFFVEDGQQATILPCLPTAFHCGRLINSVWERVGTIDLEWTKKQARQLHLKASTDTVVTLQFPRQLGSYRLWSQTKDKGRRLKCGESFEVKAGNVYRIDRFEK